MIKEHNDIIQEGTQALVLVQKSLHQTIADQQESLLISEEDRKRELLKKRLAKYKVIEKKTNPEQTDIQDTIFNQQQELLQKRQKVEIGAVSDAKLYTPNVDGERGPAAPPVKGMPPPPPPPSSLTNKQRHPDPKMYQNNK